VVAPTDAQQGEVYRIIYYHVPSAWTAFLLFFINFIASIQYLVSRKPSSNPPRNGLCSRSGWWA
jgi:heme exporter protein C